MPDGRDVTVTDCIEVITTVPSREKAREIAALLVQRRLAACVQVSGPIDSTYWWQGKLETAQEWQCVAKTRRENYTQVEAAIRQVHPYETPEILALAVQQGLDDYLRWLGRETSQGG